MGLVVIWVWFCSYLNCAGWALSAIHQLNAGGYAVVLAIGLAALILWRKKTSARILPPFHLRKLRRRFRKPFPLAFLILAAMAFLGGVIYPPSNYDALTYRIPRILHWLTAGHWHWIHTILDRINDRSCGIEWVSAPIIALLKTDRPLFLINIVSFLLLPGLVFSAFTRLGVRRRVAWHWMWIVPTGYGFLLQAGSIANDLFGAPFVLAAVVFAMRAAISKSARDFFTSILAAAMMTSAKTSTLPMLLPWAIAIFPSLKLIWRRLPATAMVCALAIFASVLPTVYFNQKFYHNWSGVHMGDRNVKDAVALKVGANIVLLAIENFVPPVFPPAYKWNHEMDVHLPQALTSRLAKLMEHPADKFYLDQMQIEENAGLGFGVCALLLVSLITAKARVKNHSAANDSTWRKLVRWSPMVSLAALLIKANLVALARILIPYYALLILPLLAWKDHERLVKEGWWRTTVLIVFVIAGGLLIIQPARPLFPALTVSKRLQAHYPASRLVARIKEVYSVYHYRNDAFAPARDILPPGLKVLGLTTFDEPATSLWRPFGSRKIVHVCPGDTPDYLKSRGVKYMLVKGQMFGGVFPESLSHWLTEMNAQIVKKIRLNLRATTGPTEWYLVELH